MDSINKTLEPRFSDPNNYKPSLNIAFESTLKYVYIPIPDSNGDLQNLPKMQAPHDEVNRILQWLTLEKGVRKIIELRVVDSSHRPHREDQIVDAIRKFDVEIFDWRVVDLSIDCVLDAAPNVEELHLYSCTWNSLCQWTSKEGAIIIPKVRAFF
jgi:hypothetical protein